MTMFSYRRLLALCRWGVAIPLACAFAAPGRAALTGSFAPANWVLVNTNKDEALPHASYTCAGAVGSLGNDVACVDLTDPGNGAFDLYGSAEGFLGGENTAGAASTNRASLFYVVNGGVPVLLGFDWFFTADGNNSDVASYWIGDGSSVIETVLSSSTSTVTSSIAGLLIPTNGSIAFQVKTDNKGNAGMLGITNFNASPVPGPLPVLGAAAAYRASRRLRGRVRGAVQAGHRQVQEAGLATELGG